MADAVDQFRAGNPNLWTPAHCSDCRLLRLCRHIGGGVRCMVCERDFREQQAARAVWRTLTRPR